MSAELKSSDKVSNDRKLCGLCSSFSAEGEYEMEVLATSI